MLKASISTLLDAPSGVAMQGMYEARSLKSSEYVQLPFSRPGVSRQPSLFSLPAFRQPMTLYIVVGLLFKCPI